MPALKLTTIEKSADGLDSAFTVTQGESERSLRVPANGRARKQCAAEKIAFDGERLFVRRVNGKLRSVVLVNGTSVRVDGKEIIKLAKPEKWIAIDFGRAGRKEYRAGSRTRSETGLSGGHK